MVFLFVRLLCAHNLKRLAEANEKGFFRLEKAFQKLLHNNN